METLITTALASAAVSFTITWTSIFEPLREAVSKRMHPKLDQLIHCPWCLNHYVALVAVPVAYPFGTITLTSAVLHWFAIVGLGGVVHYVLLRAYEPVSKREMYRKADRQEEEEPRKDK